MLYLNAAKARRLGLALLLSIPLLFAGVVASAQNPPAGTEQKSKPGSDKATRIALASASGEPGTSVVVPIYFSAAEGISIGHIKVNVTFVSRNLKFSRLDKGIATEMADVDLRSEIKEQKEKQNDRELEVATLTIETSAPAEQANFKGIPSGLLAYINFKINPDARKADITLRVSAEATELDTTKPVPDVRAIDAQVKVLAPGSTPLVTCFFFTH